MRKNDNFADSLASDMEAVMNSAEHKELFKKTAQVAGQHLPNAPVGTSTSAYGTPNAPMGKAPVSKPVQMLSGDLNSQLQQLAKMPELLGFGASADAALGLVSSILSHSANFTGLDENSPVVKQLFTAINKDALGVAKTPQGLLLALETINGEKNKAVASESIVDTIVKIANFLGDNEFIMSEAIADSLIQSIIVEAKKKVEKSKKDKKLEKKVEKDEKKMSKKEEEKEEKKCKECKKVCEKCVCE